jgi:hypothetical protein
MHENNHNGGNVENDDDSDDVEQAYVSDADHGRLRIVSPCCLLRSLPTIAVSIRISSLSSLRFKTV